MKKKQNVDSNASLSSDDRAEDSGGGESSRAVVQAAAAAFFRDRVIDFKRIKASELVPNEKNWRRHPENQRTTLRSMMEKVGIVDAAIVRQMDDGRYKLIDGHLRRDLTADQAVPVLITDLTEEEADAVLATLDPLAGMAEADSSALEHLLRNLASRDSDLLQTLATIGKMHDIDLSFVDIPPTFEDGAEAGLGIVQITFQMPQSALTDEIRGASQAFAERIGAKLTIHGARLKA